MENLEGKRPTINDIKQRREQMTVGCLYKITKDLEFDPKNVIKFYKPGKAGEPDFEIKDFMTIAKVNIVLEKMDPHKELPEEISSYLILPNKEFL